MFIKLIAFCVCLLLAHTVNSLSQEQYQTLIRDKCFNRSITTNAELILGQNEPIGLSIENLISLIERFELQNPSYSPQTVLKVFLQRFQVDGVYYNGRANVQSPTEFHHSILTEEILSDQNEVIPSFPEDQFTEDEKCNLFFTISHIINNTALKHETDSNTFMAVPLNKLAKANERYLGTEIPITVATPKAVQSQFLEDYPNKDNKKAADDKNKKIHKREATYLRELRLTKTPREYGVASFMSSSTNPVAINRMLLGLLVGFQQPTPKKMSQILDGKKLSRKLMDRAEDKEVDPLLAVTIADLYGIDTNEGMVTQNKILFGADGEWNQTTCHTNFILKTDGSGEWGTLAEFRGALDGYNIGYKLPEYRKVYPSITASQALRFYYTKSGLLPNAGICARDYNIKGSITDDLKSEAFNYLIMWNAVLYSNQYTLDTLNGYINSIQQEFMDNLNKAATLNEDEATLCQNQVSTDIVSKQSESNTDVIFLLDINQQCTLNIECPQAKAVKSIVRKLKLSRNIGSVSVLFNARGIENQNSGSGNQISTALYSNLYNSTSTQCASCKASNYDATSREVIRDRVELLELIKSSIEDFKEDISNSSCAPAKLFYWFDFGTVQPIPTERIQKVKYETVKRNLLYVQRDVTFFGISSNTSNLNDLVLNNDNLVSMDPNEVASQAKIEKLAQRICEVPAVFQYNECKLRPSNNFTHEGFISPNAKQYWAMYPDYFLKSFKVEMKFRAENAAIQVCYSREPKSEANMQNCKKALKDGEEISWIVNNPCKGYTYEKCSPFYFTLNIEGPNAENNYCTDVRCQSANQVKWTFSHVGISCNRSNKITISIIFVAICTLISGIFINKTL